MGRHSALPAPPPPDPPPHDGTPHDHPLPDRQPRQPAAPDERPRRRLIDRLALAVPAAAGTGAVMAWTGAAPAAYLLGAAGTGAVVLVAAQLAGLLPPSPRTRSDGAQPREP